MKRRSLLGAAGLLPILSGGLALPALTGSTFAAGSSGDYRALVCVFLNGGNDGFNTLVPRDGAHADYLLARPGIAFGKSELLTLPGSSGGHSWGLHPACTALSTLYNQGRLAFLLNLGPLVRPTTAAEILAGTADMPPFLFSHADQVSVTQGWGGDEDRSGWGGRTLEQLPSTLKNPVGAVSLDSSDYTLVLGQDSRITSMPPYSPRGWGSADLKDPNHYWTRKLDRLIQHKHLNQYENELTGTLASIISDTRFIGDAYDAAQWPSQDFGSSQLGARLMSLSAVIPAFKSLGYKRQVFMTTCNNNFDTHANQRGTHSDTQDFQLSWLSESLLAFDQALQASGVDDNVITLVMTDMGRTLKSNATGSDHGWGNHWWVQGGPVAGGRVYGQLPSLVLGGPDDMDSDQRGRMVPTMAVDQVGMALARWLGLPEAAETSVFPNLVNFQQKSVGFIAA